MIFLTPFNGGRSKLLLGIAAALILSGIGLRAQDTSAEVPEPGEMAQKSPAPAATNAAPTNVVPGMPTASTSTASSADASAPMAPPTPPATPTPETLGNAASSGGIAGAVVGTIVALGSLAGFLLYYCGLTRAKNSGHTVTLVLVGALVGLLGYWIGGFALQCGGMGDIHAALMQPPDRTTSSALDYEIGWHHWGIMGSAGFFLAGDSAARNGLAVLFLAQAAMALIAVTAALGAALERAKLIAVIFCAYLIGFLIYPLFANWTWGGGWLAEIGRELHLGNGFVDPGGAGVVHETAGALALVLAVILGPRHGRFGRTQPAFTIPGHNVPFLVLGSVILLASWICANSFLFGTLPVDPSISGLPSCAGLAAVNTLLAAIGGLVATFIHALARKSRPEPARLCRGLLGGAVSACSGAGLVDAWAGFLIGAVAGVLVQLALEQMERHHIDDSTGAAAVHGAAGAWGVLATGFFADGSGGYGLNGASQTVRGLFYGGGAHQLAAQLLGAITCFASVYLLGYLIFNLVHKILGARVPLDEEMGGLDFSETGSLGYQGDVEPEE